jgi:RNA polymerase sigma-70 factor (ECF subfamily)
MADSDPSTSDLMSLYLEKRADLVRLFTNQTSSKAEAEDIVQEVWIKINSLREVRVDNPVAYLYRLATNVMLDRIRSVRRAAKRDDAYYRAGHARAIGAEDKADTPLPEDIVGGRQQLARLLSAIKDLPPQCQRVFVLHKLEGLSYAEVAETMAISRSAVEKHMISALRRLATLRPT